MNSKCYKLISPKRLKALAVVAEDCVGHSKSSGAGLFCGVGTVNTFARYVGILSFAYLSVYSAYGAPAVDALPQGGVVAQGGASIQSSANIMNITQLSDRAVVNWQSFDIGSAASVNVRQPSATSVLLNRVVGDNPSQIFGSLNANGQVVLVNPKGIVFGSDGSVNAAAFTASTLGISDADFMAGNYRFVGGNGAGAILNQGAINTRGYVALLGAKVTNDGLISTQGGNAYFGAAETIALSMTNSGRVRMELTPASVNASIENTQQGAIVTQGGQVFVQASAINDAIASAHIIQSGLIDTSAAQAGGVTLLADNIKVNGSIKANSADPANKGGDIIIGLDDVTGMLATVTDVSGATLQTNNGFLETSAHRLAVDNTHVKAGQWLIDPYDIEITDSANALSAGYTTKITTQTLQAALNSGTDVVIQTSASGPATGVGVDTTGTSSGLGNILVTTAITKNADTSSGTDPNASLTLRADRTITLNAGISSTNGKLDLTLSSGHTTATGGIQINTGSAIVSNGGNISLTSQGASTIETYSNITGGIGNVAIQNTGGFIRARGGATISGKNISIDNTGGVIDATTGAITRNTSQTTGSGIEIFNANITATGNLGIVGVSSTGTVGVKAQQSTTTATGPLAQLTAAGDINIYGKSTLERGVLIYSGAKIESTAGSVTITGSGKSTTTAQPDIDVEDFAVLKAYRNLNLTGEGTWITLSNTQGANNVSTAGSITITADNLTLGANLTASSGTVTLQNYSSGTQINLGGADAVGALGIDATELSKITATQTIFGSSTAGNVTVSAASSTNANGNLSIKTAGNVNIANALTVGTTGAKNLSIEATGANSTVYSGGLITAAGLKLSGSNAAVSLGNYTHQINTLTANVKSLNFHNGKALLVGQVDGQTGLQVTDVANLTVAGALTTDASTNATISGGALYADAITIGTSGQHLQTNVASLYATAAGDEYITNTSALTVAATTTAANGKIDISTTAGSLTVNTVNGHTGITANGNGTITLSGQNTATSGYGLEIRQNISTTGDISLTGTTDANNLPVGTAYAGILNAAVVQGGNITLNATANHASADVLGYYGAGGSLYATNALAATATSNGGGAGFYMWGGTTQSATGMTVTGSSNTNVGVKIEHTAAMTNTTSGVLSITATSGDFITGMGNNTITNSGIISLKAGQNASSAGSFNGTYLTVTQNGNATTTVQTTGTGNLTAPKIVNNGTGNVVVAAGSSIAAGTAAGGNVLTVSGNTITQNNNGKTYIYTGSLRGTGVLTNVSADFSSLYYSGSSHTLNAAFNIAYNSTIVGGANAQVLFRDTTLPSPSPDSNSESNYRRPFVNPADKQTKPEQPIDVAAKSHVAMLGGDAVTVKAPETPKKADALSVAQCVPTSLTGVSLCFLASE